MFANPTTIAISQWAILPVLVVLASAASATHGGDGEPELAPALDAHTHFYDPGRPQGVPWPGKEDKLLYRTVLPGDFKKLTKNHRVVSTIVVEASPWLEDNQWLLDLAARDPFVVGVVGHLDPGRFLPSDSRRVVGNLW